MRFKLACGVPTQDLLLMRYPKLEHADVKHLAHVLPPNKPSIHDPEPVVLTPGEQGELDVVWAIWDTDKCGELDRGQFRHVSPNPKP